jgi:cell division protein FtsL
MKTPQRPRREQDPRARRTVARALAGAVLLVSAALGIAGLRLQHYHLAYQLEHMRTERARLERTLRELEIEVATLRSPARVESRARRLGLVSPGQEQVHLAREFVPAGSGLAAADRERAEARLR